MNKEIKNDDAIEVSIVDIKMPFFSMIFFMVKWMLASIPAVALFIGIMGLISMIIAPYYHPHV